MQKGVKKRPDANDASTHVLLWNDLELPNPRTFPSLSQILVQHVAAGANHVAILAQDGRLFTSGNNDFGQLGLGDVASRREAEVVATLEDDAVTAVSCGYRHTAAIGASGALYCWGDCVAGQCGMTCTRGEKILIPRPVTIIDTAPPCEHSRQHSNRKSKSEQPLEGHRPRMLDVACGELHTVALSEYGEVWVWGSGKALGQLMTETCPVPRLLTFLQGRRVLQISCGARHTLALVESLGATGARTRIATHPSTTSSAATGGDGKNGAKRREQSRETGTAAAAATGRGRHQRSASPVIDGTHYHRSRPATCVKCKQEIYTFKETKDACIVCNKHVCPLGLQVRDPQAKVKAKTDPNRKTSLPASRQSSMEHTSGTFVRRASSQEATYDVDDPRYLEGHRGSANQDGEMTISRDAEGQQISSESGPIGVNKNGLMTIYTGETSAIKTGVSSPIAISLPGTPGSAGVAGQGSLPSSPLMKRMGNFFQYTQPMQDYMTNITSSVVDNIKTSVNRFGNWKGRRDDVGEMEGRTNSMDDDFRSLGPLNIEDVQLEGSPRCGSLPKSKSSEPSSFPLGHRRMRSLPEDVIQFSERDSHRVYQDEVVVDTEVWTWGAGTDGQLGHGDSLERLQPCHLAFFNEKHVVKLVAGGNQSLALTASSRLYNWGIGHVKTENICSPQEFKIPHGPVVWDAAVVGSRCMAFVYGADSRPQLAVSADGDRKNNSDERSDKMAEDLSLRSVTTETEVSTTASRDDDVIKRGSSESVSEILDQTKVKNEDDTDDPGFHSGDSMPQVPDPVTSPLTSPESGSTRSVSRKSDADPAIVKERDGRLAFKTLQLPDEDMYWRQLSGGSDVILCLLTHDPSGMEVTLHEFAASERLFYRQLGDVRDNLIKPLLELEKIHSLSGLPEWQQMMHLFAAFLIVCDMVVLHPQELSRVINRRLSPDKLQLCTQSSIISEFKHYANCYNDLSVINGFETCVKEVEFVRPTLEDKWDSLLASVLLPNAPDSGSVKRHPPLIVGDQKSHETLLRVLTSLPLDHLSKYKTFLATMATYYPPYSPLHAKLSAAATQWGKFQRWVVTERTVSEKTREFWQQLYSYHPKKVDALRLPQRRILRDGREHVLKLKGYRAYPKSNKFIALFNDLLVCFQPSGLVEYPLETVWVELQNEPEAKKSKPKFNLVITLPEESITVTTETPEDRADWYNAFCDAIHSTLNLSGETLASRPADVTYQNLVVPSERQACHVFTKNPQYKDATYRGCWKDGQPHGQGAMKWPDESRFIGIFHEGQFLYGTYIHNVDTAPEQQIGQWKDWKLHGHGEIRYHDGREHKGAFQDGKRHGFGCVFAKVPVERFLYMGGWAQDRRNGYGVEILENETYMGMWADDHRSGSGVLVTIDGLYFEGNFSNNKMTGTGLLIAQDSMCYEGYFHGAMFNMHGMGKVTFPNGDYIEGKLYGTYSEGITVNGTLRKGEHKDNDRHGNFIHEVERRAASFGKLATPADMKWKEEIFRQCYNDLGFQTTSPGVAQSDPVEMAVEAWQRLVSGLKTRVEREECMRQNDVNSQSKKRANMLTSLPSELLDIPRNLIKEPLTFNSYRKVRHYLSKAFCCPFHPLGRMLSDLVSAYRGTYSGSWLSCHLLRFAVEDVTSYVNSIYNIVRMLFPCLPQHHSEPLRGGNDETEDVTPEGLLHPLILPEVYPTLFNLYAVYHAEEDAVYQRRLLSLNKKEDVAQGIRQRYYFMDDDSYDRSSLRFDLSMTNKNFTEAVETLKRISTKFSPIEKLLVLEQTCKEIERIYGQDHLTMDSLLPIFIFVVIRAKIQQLGAEIHFTKDLMDKSLEHGLLGQCLTNLQAAYQCIRSNDDKVFPPTTP